MTDDEVLKFIKSKEAERKEKKQEPVLVLDKEISQALGFFPRENLRKLVLTGRLKYGVTINNIYFKSIDENNR